MLRKEKLKMKEFLWVTNTAENKAFYSDSSKDGIYLHFDKDVDDVLKRDINAFIKYLRREFYFPIKCNIYIKSSPFFPSNKKGKTCNGIFFKNDEYKNIYPQIFVATGDVNNKYNVFFVLCHELTHYFQWYFMLEKDHSDKGLEIQATKYANDIVSDYYYATEDRSSIIESPSLPIKQK